MGAEGAEGGRTRPARTRRRTARELFALTIQGRSGQPVRRRIGPELFALTIQGTTRLPLGRSDQAMTIGERQRDVNQGNTKTSKTFAPGRWTRRTPSASGGQSPCVTPVSRLTAQSLHKALTLAHARLYFAGRSERIRRARTVLLSRSVIPLRVLLLHTTWTGTPTSAYSSIHAPASAATCGRSTSGRPPPVVTLAPSLRALGDLTTSWTS